MLFGTVRMAFRLSYASFFTCALSKRKHTYFVWSWGLHCLVVYVVPELNFLIEIHVCVSIVNTYKNSHWALWLNAFKVHFRRQIFSLFLKTNIICYINHVLNKVWYWHTKVCLLFRHLTNSVRFYRDLCVFRMFSLRQKIFPSFTLNRYRISK